MQYVVGYDIADDTRRSRVSNCPLDFTSSSGRRPAAAKPASWEPPRGPPPAPAAAGQRCRPDEKGDETAHSKLTL